MELNYLHEFVVLAKNCHFQEAAAQLFISQSSLSKHIKAIETELGQELFSRSTRKAELTAFGREFLPYATKISEIQYEYNCKLLNLATYQAKQIRIGISQLVTLYNVQDLLENFAKHSSEFTITFVDLDETPLQEVFSKGQCQLAIAIQDDSKALAEYGCIPYTRDSLVAILPNGHPLAKEPYLTTEQLRGSRFIQFGHSNLLQLLDERFTASCTISHSTTLIKLIAKDVGIGIVTKYFANYIQPTDVCVIPIVPETTLQMNVYYPKHQQKNPAIAYILKWFQERK